MLTYNTLRKKLILPEYGRNIQRMIDHCLTIEDRDERTACAHTIIKTMSILFPSNGNADEYNRKLWDHLAIMSGFKLDIDWPYEVVKPEIFETTPDPVPLPYLDIPHRQYGKILIDMIDVCASMPEGEERDELALMIANQMKKIMSASSDMPDDAKILQDLRSLSHGVLHYTTDQLKLHEYTVLAAPNKKKKKK